MVIISGLFYNQSNQMNITVETRTTNFILSFFLQGIPIAIAQSLFSYSLLICKSSGIVTMMNFLGVVLGYFVSIFRYDETINVICLAGTCLVLLGIYRIVLVKAWGNKKMVKIILYSSINYHESYLTGSFSIFRLDINFKSTLDNWHYLLIFLFFNKLPVVCIQP
jgi:hypothetical protein